jgi:hypothetical protein
MNINFRVKTLKKAGPVASASAHAIEGRFVASSPILAVPIHVSTNNVDGHVFDDILSSYLTISPSL